MIALGPVVWLLGGDGDGCRRYAALVDGRPIAADGHGQAGDGDGQALCDSQGLDPAGEGPHDVQREEPDDQAIQALGTGDDLEDQTLGEVLRSRGQKARSSFAGHAGAPGRAHAAQSHRQRGAQESKANASELFQKADMINLPP